MFLAAKLPAGVDTNRAAIASTNVYQCASVLLSFAMSLYCKRYVLLRGTTCVQHTLFTKVQYASCHTSGAPSIKQLELGQLPSVLDRNCWNAHDNL